MANKLDIIKNINNELDTTVKKLGLLDGEVVTISQNLRKAVGGFTEFKLPKEFQATTKSARDEIERLKKVQQEQSRIIEKLVADYEKLKNKRSSAAKKGIQQREAEKALRKELRIQARAALDLGNAYDNLQANTTKLIRKYNDLATRKQLGKKLTEQEEQQLKSLTKQIQRQNAALARVDKAAGKFQRNVGNYPKALINAASAARSLASALGLVGGAFLFVRTIGAAIKTVRDFEKQNATLAAVLQKTTDETRELQSEAKRLGETTVRSATEITNLQLSYARLGFEQQEIIDLTQATIDGSIALNSALDETATLVGGVVNAFTDLSTTDSPRILDVLSLATAKSALDFEKLNTALPIVSGAASALNVSFEETVSLLGKLADANIDSSTAATSLRNIFIESGKSGQDFRDILLNISQSQDKLTAANDAFGKRAAVSAVVLANNIEATNELNDALENAGGTAREVAEKELDTLDGSLKLLKSAWEGVVLGTNDATDASEKLKIGIRTLAQNLGDIVSAVFLGVKAFIAYKLAVLAVSIQQRILNFELVNSRKAALAARFGVSKLTIAWRSFNKALKRNVVGIVTTALFLLVDALDFSSKSIVDLVEDMVDLNKEFASQQREVLNTTQELKGLVDTYDELSSKSDLSKEENIKLKDSIEKIAEVVPEAITQIDEYGKSLSISRDRAMEFIEENNKLVELKTSKEIEEQEKALKKLQNTIASVSKIQKEGNQTFIEGVGIVKNVDGELRTVTKQYSRLGNEYKIGEKLTKDQTIAYLEYVKSLKDSEQDLETQIQLNKEIVLNSKGLQSQRQKEADALKRKQEQDKKDIESQKASTLLIPKLREEIKLLAEERKKLVSDGVTEDEEERINQIDKETKALKSRIKAIIENNDENDKSIKALKGSIAFIEQQIKKLEEQRSKLAENSKQWQEYTDLIDNATKALSLLQFQLSGVELEPVGDQLQSSTQRIREALDDIYKSLGIENPLKEATDNAKKELDQQIEDFENAEKEKARVLKEALDLQNDLRQEFTQTAIDSINSIFEAQSQRYENDIEQNNLYYDSLLENEALSDEQREALENQREEKNKRLREKQKEAEKKAFLFNQGLALAEIGMNLAKTIVAINLAAASIDAVSLGTGGSIYKAINLPIAIGTAAAQTVAVLAKQAPQFAYGGTMDHDGLMVINDHPSGRQEIVKRGNQLLMTPEKNALVYGKKGDEIIPDAKAYLNDLSDDDLSYDLGRHIYNANLAQQSIVFDRLMQQQTTSNQQLINELREVGNIIDRKKLQLNLRQDMSSLGKEIGNQMRYNELYKKVSG